jgi:ABC-2 type transport system permease protein
MLVGLSITTGAFFGQGISVVVQRERGMLRRYRLTPLGSGGLLAGTVIAGLVTLAFTIGIQLALLRFAYHAPMDFRAWQFVLVTLIGSLAMASLGLIIAAIASTMQEANLLMQITFMSTIFISGMTIPLSQYPPMVQKVAQFLPPTHVVKSLNDVFFHQFTRANDAAPLAALLIMASAAFTVATRLFRWEKDDPLPRRAKASALLALTPVLLFGAWQTAHTPGHVAKPAAHVRHTHKRAARQ